MMTAAAARALLGKLAEGEAKNGRNLNYVESGNWAYCPVCGTNQMGDFSFKFAVIDGRDIVADKDGLLMVFYISHPAIYRRCIFGMAGAPENGHIAEQLLGYGEAIQALGMEALMKGRSS